MSRINNKTIKNQKKVRRWVIIHTNMVGYEIDDANMCFMGCKSMGKCCIIMSKASS
jgi:Holliday junction resolvasome RuvABC DNA-binding subunit